MLRTKLLRCCRTESRKTTHGSKVNGRATVAAEDRRQLGSNPVVPTFFRNEPFGENVEGLSHCGDESCGSQIVFK
jgi:hypothetical protein